MNFDLDASTDEDFFGALKRKQSNLDELFGIAKTQQQNEQQQSLKYKSIKPPTADDTNDVAGNAGTTPPPAQVWQTLLAKVANGFKEGALTGKVAVALLSNAASAHKIIIYKTKAHVLATCTLQAETTQVHLQKRYLQFYDDTTCYWSIYFDLKADEQEFVDKLRELNIAISAEAGANVKLIYASTNNVSESTEQLTEGVQAASAESDKSLVPAVKPPKDTHSKSALITRMAKMGQQLPKLSPSTQSSIDCTDSSDTEVITTPMAAQSKPALMPRSSSKSLLKNQMVPVCNANMNAMYNPTTTVAMSTASNNLETQFMQMLLTENRSQNTELRMNIGKLETKMEKVLDKIDLIRTHANDKSDKEDEILALEEKLLELKKENRKLRLDIEASAQRSTDKSCVDILERYQDELADAELSNVDNLERLVGSLLRQRASTHAKLEQWERELALKNEQLHTQQTHLKDAQGKREAVDERLQELQKQVSSLQLELADKIGQEAKLQRKYTEESMATQQLLEGKVRTLQERLDVKEKSEEVLRQQLAENVESQMQQKQQQEAQTETIVKEIMNKLYSNLAHKLEILPLPLQRNVVIALIGKSIREETLKAMEQLKQ